MTRSLIALVAALPMVALLLVAPQAARADATITSATVENGYPNSLKFNLAATAPVNVTDVTLRYEVVGRGTTAFNKPEQFTPTNTVNTTVTVDVNPNTNWLPVGSTLRWHFELTLADGTTTVAPDQDYLYLPSGSAWQNTANDIAIVYFHAADSSLAGRILTALQQTYDQHGKTLLKTDLPVKPVKVVLFSDSRELQPAIPSKGATIDNSETVVTCGVRPANSSRTNDIILSTARCGVGDPVDTARHEFGHLLNAAAGEGTLVKLPFWLDEGLAVYAQARQDDYVAAFQAATSRNRLIPFSNMGSGTADQNQIILQYGQAFMMTKYLIDTYGAAKLDAMLALTKKNTRIDDALKQAYGFDLSAFEKEFTAKFGSGTAATPTAAATRPQQQNATPTAAGNTAGQRGNTPTAAPAGSGKSSSSGGGSGISRTAVVIIGVAVLFVLLAVMALLVMLYLQNQRRGPGSAA